MPSTLALREETQWVPEKRRRTYMLAHGGRTITCSVVFKSAAKYDRVNVVFTSDDLVENCIEGLVTALGLSKTTSYRILLAGKVLRRDSVLEEAFVSRRNISEKLLLVPEASEVVRKNKRDHESDFKVAVSRKRSRARVSEMEPSKESVEDVEVPSVDPAVYQRAKERALMEIELRFGKVPAPENSVDIPMDVDCNGGKAADEVEVNVEELRANRIQYLQKVTEQRAIDDDIALKVAKLRDESEAKIIALRRSVDAAIQSGDRELVMKLLMDIREVSTLAKEAEVTLREKKMDEEVVNEKLEETKIELLPLTQRSLPTKHGNYMTPHLKAREGRKLEETVSQPSKEVEWYRCWTNYDEADSSSKGAESTSSLHKPLPQVKDGVSSDVNRPGYNILKKTVMSSSAHRPKQLGSIQDITLENEAKHEKDDASGQTVTLTNDGGAALDIEGGMCTPVRYGDSRKKSHIKTDTSSSSSWWNTWCKAESGSSTDSKSSDILKHVGVPWSALGGRPIGG